MFLTDKDILESDDQEFEIVNTPEWRKDSQVKVAIMSGYERDKYEMSTIGKNGEPNLVNIRAKLCAATLTGENGEKLFSEQHITKLGKKSGVVLDRIVEVAQRINKLSESAIEEEAKN